MTPREDVCVDVIGCSGPLGMMATCGGAATGGAVVDPAGAGLELVEVPDGDQCCGSAGIYNLVQPVSADLIGARKAAAVLATGAGWLASGNPGCTLHIQGRLRERGADIQAAQPIEILDASIRAASKPGGD